MNDTSLERARQRDTLSLSSRALEHARSAAAVLSLGLGVSCTPNQSGALPAPSSDEPATPSLAPPSSDLPTTTAPEAPLPAANDGSPEGLGDVPLAMPPEPAANADADTGEPVAAEPPPCTPIANPGSLDDADINVDLATELQTISGFGGMNMPRWIDDLTPEQADTAFGAGPGQLGLSMLRIGISQDENDFAQELPTARRAAALGVKIVSTPWTPPANLKTNNDIVGGELQRANYGAYADHLMAFVRFMQDNDVAIEALSIQNEPDIEVDYDSCDWSPQQLIDFLIEQGPRFGEIRIMAPESFNFNRQRTDPLLNNAQAAAQFEIVAGHVYGGGLADYPLARQRGKEVWMTEHFTDTNEANSWPSALDVGAELNRAMRANFNAYIWWYVRRSYGLISENGQVSKRGYLMSQYSRFIRPGFVRVGATDPGAADGVQVTAYKNGPGQVVIVAINTSPQPRNVNLDLFGSCVTSFERFTTSATKNAGDDGPVTLQAGRAAVTLDAQSLTTFVSQDVPSSP